MTTSENPNLPVTPLNPTVEAPANPVVSVSTQDSQASVLDPTEKSKGKNTLVLISLSIVLLIVVAVGIYLFWYNSKTENTPPKDVISMPTIVPSVIPTEEETSLKTYTGSTGFSFVYSDIAWTLTEKPMSVEVPGLDGLQEFTQIELSHNLDNYKLVINYKPKDSDSDMTLYGGAAGEFKEVGSVNFRGEMLARHNLVFEGATVQAHYNRAREFTRGETTYTIAILPNNFEGTLEESNIEQAELVLASFKPLPSKTYSSTILEDFSFQYPASWALAVKEVDDLGLENIKSNLITLSKLDHTLTINISPTVLFGGEMYCYKEGDITFDYADDLVRVYKHNLFSDYSEKDFKYFLSENLDSKSSNPSRFNSALSVWTPGDDDDDEHVACGTLDFTTTADSIYSYGDLDNNTIGESGNPDTKIKGVIIIEGSYTSVQIDPNILQEMDAIVRDILQN